MSGIKTILAVVRDGDSTLITLETAFLLARDLGCHVRVLAVRPDPTAVLPLAGEALTAGMVDELMAVYEREGVAKVKRLRDIFNAFCTRYNIPVTDEPPGPAGISAAFREAVGQEEDVVLRHGRLHDLIVVPRSSGPKTDQSLQATLNSALMDTGRPVLVAPKAMVSTLAKTVAIAWNGSIEAIHAVTAALPLLIRADRVVVLVADQSPDLLSATDLEGHLAWHGVDVNIHQVMPASAESLGKAILQAAAGEGADMLLMGAFTHSRLRELLMGGVTRTILDCATLPVMLAH